MVDLTYVQSEKEYAVASELFIEYATWLNIDLTFQNFSSEITKLDNIYGPPNGCIILAKNVETYIGCIAVRKIDAETCELKRMYVKPAGQLQGTGTLLLSAALKFAMEAGYKKMQLDTLNTMMPAIKLYVKNGFYEIAPYYYNPEPTAVFFERKL